MEKNSGQLLLSSTMGDAPETPNTMASPDKSRGGGIKKKKNPISIEAVFNQVSMLTAANINPPPGRVLLTPRSAEVCLKQGVNPEILKVRDIDSFWEPNIDPSVQRMRHEAYVQRRHDIMKQCRLDRKKLINSELDQAAKEMEVSGGTSGPAPATMTPEMILEEEMKKGSAMIEQEKARIKKMQARQQRELEQMIEFEINRAKIQEDMARKIQESKKQEELKLKQQEKRLRLMAEERRLKDLQKVALEEAEEAKRREMAKRAFAEEKKLADIAAKKAEEDRKRRREEDAEKKRLHEEHQRQVAKFFADHQMELRRRMEAMQGADQKKKAAMDERARLKAIENKKKRDAAETRLAKNFEMSRMVENKKKQDFLDKKKQFEDKRQIMLEEQERQRELHSQEIMLQEQRRRMLLIQSHKEEERRKEMMLQSFEEEGKAIEVVRAQREKEMALQKERQALKRQMKAENVERVSRIKEYERMQTLKKIEDTQRRTDAMVSMKAKLTNDRRQSAASTKLQKEKIAAVMDSVRSDASKAQKIISKALSGKISLAALTGTDEKKKTSKPRRSKSASNLHNTDTLPPVVQLEPLPPRSEGVV